jgi:hypothetical protein
MGSVGTSGSNEDCYLVCLVYLVFWLNKTNQMNQINQINKTNQMNQRDRVCVSAPGAEAAAYKRLAQCRGGREAERSSGARREQSSGKTW